MDSIISSPDDISDSHDSDICTRIVNGSEGVSKGSTAIKSFHLILEAFVLLDIFTPRDLYKLSQVDWTSYDIVAWKLDKLRALYNKWLPRVGRAIHRRLIGNPINYPRRVTTVEKLQHMSANRHTGLQLFNMASMPFTNVFLRDNRIAITNVTIWMKYPTPFATAFIVANDATGEVSAIMMRQVSKDEYTEINDMGLYYVQLGMPTERNPILLGVNGVRHHMLYLAVAEKAVPVKTAYGDAFDIVNDLDFMIEFIDRVIVSYNVVSETEYVWTDYAFGFNGNFEKQWNTAAFTRTIASLKDADGNIVTRMPVPQTQIFQMTQTPVIDPQHLPFGNGEDNEGWDDNGAYMEYLLHQMETGNILPDGSIITNPHVTYMQDGEIWEDPCPDCGNWPCGCSDSSCIYGPDDVCDICGQDPCNCSDSGWEESESEINFEGLSLSYVD